MESWVVIDSHMDTDINALPANCGDFSNETSFRVALVALRDSGN